MNSRAWVISSLAVWTVVSFALGCGSSSKVDPSQDAAPALDCSGPQDCPGVDGACSARACDNGTCGVAVATAGATCSEGTGVMCDGAGSCVECIAGTDCASGACQNGLCVPATCIDDRINGNETDVDCGGSCAPCQDGQACLVPDDCTTRFCDANVCAACGDSTDCATSEYCDNSGACVSQRDNGGTCASGQECLSGNCPTTDGVCCDRACDGTCEACRNADTGDLDGTCAPVVAGTDPTSECVAQDVSTCGISGQGCNGLAQAPGCNVYASGTPCAAAACGGWEVLAESQCDGAGLCVATAQPVSCTPYACDANGPMCLSSCTNRLDCSAGHVCQNGVCTRSEVLLGAADLLSCGVNGSGLSRCWGNNPDGQLGNGTTTDSQTAVGVVGLSDVVEIAPSRRHSCALTGSGGVKCWGSGLYLGYGSNQPRLIPFDVPALTSGVADIATGAYHTCAVTDAGGVTCWGANTGGQLGDGTTMFRSTPVDVVGVSGRALSVAAGPGQTCVLLASGGIECWGRNDSGQLGTGDTVDSLTPVDVTVVPGGSVVDVALGSHHTCALTTAGHVKCWGLNSDGQLGDGTRVNSLTPVEVTGLAGIRAIAGGAWHTCALTSLARVKCWGRGGDGQLGYGSFFTRDTPQEVVGLTSVTQIAAGDYHTCALVGTNTVKCWGWNNQGGLGDGTQIDRSSPVTVIGF